MKNFETQNGLKIFITKQTNKQTNPNFDYQGVLESKNKVNHVSTNLQTVSHIQLPRLSISNLWLRRNPQNYDTKFEFIQRVHNYPELQQKCSIRKNLQMLKLNIQWRYRSDIIPDNLDITTVNRVINKANNSIWSINNGFFQHFLWEK